LQGDLDLGRQPYTRWPDPSTTTSDVRRLYLDHADLDQLPADVMRHDRLADLRELVVSNNNIAHLPSSITRLRTLK
jgi:Leucine-rich repeat (LRR) protein